MLPLALFLQAAPAHHPSFEAAFRTGLSIPVGYIESNVPIQEVAGLQVPIMADLGVRASPRVFIGGYASVGIGSTNRRFDRDYCPGHDCAARTLHIGGEIHLHLRPTKTVDPWVGAGIGYEWFFMTGVKRARMDGIEALRPMLGVDLRLSKNAALGLFLDAPLGVYTTYEPADSALNLPSDNRIHSWITFGLRLALSRAPGS